MPQLTPFFTNRPKPTMAKITEKATAWKRHRTKSYFVLTKICMVLVSSPLDADRGGAILRFVDDVEDHARDEERREHRREETDQQRDGKSLDRTGAELEEEERRDDRGHVGIDDRAEGSREAVLDGSPDRLPIAELLANALEDEDIRVDGHTECEDDAGDAGQRQRGVEDGHHPEQDDEVQQQGQHGVDAGAPVIEQDREDQCHKADERCRHTLTDGVASEGRSDR